MVKFASGGETIDGYLSLPVGGGPAPGIVVIQEIWGLADHIKDVADRLAREGYAALAPDLYSREGTPQPPTMEVLRPFAFNIPDSRIVEDLKAAVTYLAGEEAARGRPVGVVGFCMGGALARLLAAQDERVAACVDYYGRVHWPELSRAKPQHPVEYASRLACPYLGLFAGEDPTIPPADVEELTRGLARNQHAELHVYPDAPHAFFNDTRPSYRKPVAEDAWARTIRFFGRHLPV